MGAPAPLVNWPADPEDLFLELHVEFGMSVAAIAELLELPEAAIAEACRNFGIIREAAPEPVDPGPEPGDRGPKEPRGCRWIDGDVRSSDWSYCQEKEVPGARHPYCRHHLLRSYQRASAAASSRGLIE
ncbi:hypothetical protein D3093_35275 (plasmid) [Azospirillum argentinense]|uniref:GcrA cell cycle regulator n=1 Tax=Azospirillum argentinense TaxID=2970906 RepID=A0A4D8PXC1_9PROT|nr:hypothetical protein [Azospirillum argentinense]QCO00509.1 hypothetical protein D3093_35275 [Azospirillum argentinense]